MILQQHFTNIRETRSYYILISEKCRNVCRIPVSSLSKYIPTAVIESPSGNANSF
jgi:hypothetical protein